MSDEREGVCRRAGRLTLREAVEQVAHQGERSHLDVTATQPPA